LAIVAVHHRCDMNKKKQTMIVGIGCAILYWLVVPCTVDIPVDTLRNGCDQESRVKSVVSKNESRTIDCLYVHQYSHSTVRT
jgi:hypothetical protein